MKPETETLFRPEAVAYREAATVPAVCYGNPRGHAERTGASSSCSLQPWLEAWYCTSRRAPAAEAGENPATVVVWIPAAGSQDVSVGQRLSVPTSDGEVGGLVVDDAQVGSAVSPAPDRAAVAVALDRALPPGTTISDDAVVHLPARRLLVLVIPVLHGILGGLSDSPKSPLCRRHGAR